MEKILKIIENGFRDKSCGYDQEYDGYLVITDRQTIKIGISNGQSCCENWGYLMSEDNISEFEGANLLKIEVVDSALNKKVADILKENYLELDQIMFINFETDKGTLQFVAYNSHNGYYGHDAVIISEQLTKNESL